MLTRRAFLKLTGASAVGLYAATHHGWVERAVAQVPGGTLAPADVAKYRTPLLVPPAMPRAGTIRLMEGGEADSYEISVRQFEQQILPADMPTTTVWGYGPVRALRQGKAILLHNAPSLTIEARHERPVRVKWVNELMDRRRNYLPHLLPVDQTLHWANPPGGRQGRDTRPVFEDTPGPYTGPVPIVTHVHGAVGVGDESDGYAEAWYLPSARNIPAGYAREGTWYSFFKDKAFARFQAPWAKGYATFQYPNLGRASADWYHDHTLGMTRLNVYAGPAGFYIIRGGPDGDGAVLDGRTETPAVLPGPAPMEGDVFPPDKPYYEIPIAVQDRSFNADGSLFYPDSREFFDGITRPYIPNGEFSPIWNPEFFGNMMMVNGATWPFLEVEQRRYRFRFLNGCQSRFLILDFNGIPLVETWVIGNEGGFLAEPVNLTATNGNRLLMGLAERADVIVDFTNVPLGEHVLANVGPDEPFGGGVPGVDFDPADPEGTGQVMQFRVVPAVGDDLTTPPRFLVLPPVTTLPEATVTRPLALLEEAEVGEVGEEPTEGPVAALLGTVDGTGMWTRRLWMDEVTETPQVGDTEVWEVYNATADAHPIHIHEVAFEVVDRQSIRVDEETRMVEVVEGTERPPESWETGFKDTITAYPGEVTRVKVKFDNPGQFVWHCHIVEHEDNEMMRPYRIGPVQPGQPGA